MNKIPLKKTTIFKLLKTIKIDNINKENIELTKSKNRILSNDVISLMKLPPFNNSAVDGYAIHNSNLSNLIKLKCTQRITAGDSITKNVKNGEVARIFTGARMPANSKTVVMQENVTVIKDHILINKLPRVGENCRFAGEDISKGEIIIRKGDKIDSTNLNLIAAIGKKNVWVKKKLKVGFYTSGNELKNPTEKLKGSEINNSNFYSLKTLLSEAYIENKYLGILKDSKKMIENSLLKNSDKYNVLITTGGASVGEEDYLIEAVKKIGKIFFWKTAIKPGRPLAIGKVNKTIIICFPGNPVSVHLLYGMIIKPFLEFLCGSQLIMPLGLRAIVTFSMKKKTQRLEWLRVNRIKDSKFLKVNKYPKQGSGMISSIAYADGIVEIPENVSQINVGDSFIFYSFKDLFS